MFRTKAEQKVADAGYDPARLPPGRYVTEKYRAKWLRGLDRKEKRYGF